MDVQYDAQTTQNLVLENEKGKGRRRNHTKLQVKYSLMLWKVDGDYVLVSHGR